MYYINKILGIIEDIVFVFVGVGDLLEFPFQSSIWSRRVIDHDLQMFVVYVLIIVSLFNVMKA